MASDFAGTTFDAATSTMPASATNVARKPTNIHNSTLCAMLANAGLQSGARTELHDLSQGQKKTRHRPMIFKLATAFVALHKRVNRRGWVRRLNVPVARRPVQQSRDRDRSGGAFRETPQPFVVRRPDRKSTRLNSS